MKTQSLLAVFFVVLFFPYVSFGEIYGWVDENGVKHYSNYPPPDGVNIISQDTEIRTEVAPVANELESDQADAEKSDEQPPTEEAPAEQAAGTDEQPAAPDTVATDDDEREAFHRERIKQRTRKNTSPAPSLQIEGSDAARQNPRVERKQNLP